MSTTTAHPTPSGSPASPPRPGIAKPVTLGRVMRSEWIKLRSLRGTWIFLLAIVVVLAGFGAIAAAVSSGSVSTPDNGGPQFGGDDPLSTVLTGATFATLLVGVLGALAGAREHASRMITATMAATPRRWPVVVAKAGVLSMLVLPAAAIGTIGAFGLGMGVLAANDAATVGLGDDGVIRSLVGMALYLTAVALIGLGLGLLMRSVAASIGTLAAGVLIVPALAGALLPESWDGVLQLLPTNAAAGFTAVQASTDQVLGPVTGALVLAAWVVVILGGATLSTVRRDV
ncbi:ABC transporter permease [Nocardioides sp. zg-1308]|uniref:ABC transporter permease n=1 Tax=Nocardioides sp. zg-1308 TaxID=2736253 RepID=UPI001C130777|nr:ABC transporter permease [Nocardioides sp. zg-1308]